MWVYVYIYTRMFIYVYIHLQHKHTHMWPLPSAGSRCDQKDMNTDRQKHTHARKYDSCPSNDANRTSHYKQTNICNTNTRIHDLCSMSGVGAIRKIAVIHRVIQRRDTCV